MYVNTQGILTHLPKICGRNLSLPGSHERWISRIVFAYPRFRRLLEIYQRRDLFSRHLGGRMVLKHGSIEHCFTGEKHVPLLAVRFIFNVIIRVGPVEAGVFRDKQDIVDDLLVQILKIEVLFRYRVKRILQHFHGSVEISSVFWTT